MFATTTCLNINVSALGSYSEMPSSFFLVNSEMPFEYTENDICGHC